MKVLEQIWNDEVLEPQIKKIDENTNYHFKWILEKKNQACNNDGNSEMIKVLTHKINEIIDTINNLSV